MVYCACRRRSITRALSPAPVSLCVPLYNGVGPYPFWKETKETLGRSSLALLHPPC